MQEVVLVLGFPASGKSTLSDSFIYKGFVHINRDKEGGTILELVPIFEEALKSGKNIVLDNTFPTIESRKPFLELCKSLNVKVTCYCLITSIEDAQFNAASRMVKKFGRLLNNEEIKKSKSPNTFPPAVLFNYRKNYQKPTFSEGFSQIIEVPFFRQKDPSYTNKAILLDFDGTLRVTKSGAKFPVDPEDISILPNRKEVLLKAKSDGFILLGVSNQSGVAKGDLTLEQAIKCFDKTKELLGLDIDVSFCPHSVPPISCYCRKPMPGMPVEFIEKYKLDASQCIIVGDMKTDETCADRCGMKFVHANDFFKL